MSHDRGSVAEWNRRLKDDGWRSAGDPRWCPRCQEERIVTLTTIFGKTTGYCGVCALTWDVVE